MSELSFRAATPADSALLLSWRNDPLTRKASVSTAPVREEEHQAWLAASLANPRRQLWIAMVDGEAVGVVRLDQGEEECELSWTIAPQARGKGYGKQMVRQAAESSPLPVVARIRPDNQASVRIAHSAGLIQLGCDEELTYWRSKPGASAP